AMAIKQDNVFEFVLRQTGENGAHITTKGCLRNREAARICIHDSSDSIGNRWRTHRIDARGDLSRHGHRGKNVCAIGCDAVRLECSQRQQDRPDFRRNPFAKFNPVDALHFARARRLPFGRTHRETLAGAGVFRFCFPSSSIQSTGPSNARICSKRLSVPLRGTAIKSAWNPGRIRPSFPPLGDFSNATPAFTVTISRTLSDEIPGSLRWNARISPNKLRLSLL